jgi:hypothetical protein
LKNQGRVGPEPESSGQAVSVSTDMVPKNNLTTKAAHVNLKDSPIAEYLRLLPNGEPSYLTYLILKDAIKSIMEEQGVPKNDKRNSK